MIRVWVAKVSLGFRVYRNFLFVISDAAQPAIKGGLEQGNGKLHHCHVVQGLRWRFPDLGLNLGNGSQQESLHHSHHAAFHHLEN